MITVPISQFANSSLQMGHLAYSQGFTALIFFYKEIKNDNNNNSKLL